MIILQTSTIKLTIEFIISIILIIIMNLKNYYKLIMNHTLITYSPWGFIKIFVINFLFGLFLGYLLHLFSITQLFQPIVIVNSILIVVVALITLYFAVGIMMVTQYIITRLFIKKASIDSLESIPYNSFSAIVPAYHSTDRITHTLHALVAIDYPESLKEIIIITKFDDFKTNRIVEIIRQSYPHVNISIHSYYDSPDTVAHAVNYGIHYAQNDIVAVYKEGMIPKSSVYTIANSNFQQKSIAVLQVDRTYFNYALQRSTFVKIMINTVTKMLNLPVLLSRNFLLFDYAPSFYRRSVLVKMNGLNEHTNDPIFDLNKRIIIQEIPSHVTSNSHLTLSDISVNADTTSIYSNAIIRNIISLFFSGDWILIKDSKQRIAVIYSCMLPFVIMTAFLLSSGFVIYRQTIFTQSFISIAMISGIFMLAYYVLQIINFLRRKNSSVLLRRDVLNSY